jgi:pilus assembly protein Flp/PilA
MLSFQRYLVDFLRKEEGPTAVEYAVMLAFIIVICFATIATLGSNTNNSYSTIAKQVGKSGS